MSKWLTHVKKTMKSEAGKKSSMGKKWFSYVLKTAKKSYKKHKGGDDEEPKPVVSGPSAPVGVAHMESEPTAPGGRRGRKGGKTRRHRK
jgi:hypothetical protein